MSAVNEQIRIQKYRMRYSSYQRKIIDEAIDAFSKTRTSGKISIAVLLREYQWWLKYKPQRVVAGLKTYLNKGCCIDKKNERYARGIIRLITEEQINTTQIYTNGELAELILKLKKEIIGKCDICKGTGYLFDDIDKSIVRSCKCLLEFKKKRSELLKENRGY